MMETKIDHSKQVHSGDPITSFESAEMASEFAQRHYDVIFKVLLENQEGLTSQEISGNCFLGYHQIARRLKEMGKIGLIARTGEKRKTESGRNGFVWKIK